MTDAVKGTILPVPEVIHQGTFETYDYLILSYFEGKDLGLVYPRLDEEDKRTIAGEIVCIQEKVAALQMENIPENWSWFDLIRSMLDRAEARIVRSGYYSAEKVERIRTQTDLLHDYFASVKPAAYLDDISSKTCLFTTDTYPGALISTGWERVIR